MYVGSYHWFCFSISMNGIEIKIRFKLCHKSYGWDGLHIWYIFPLFFLFFFSRTKVMNKMKNGIRIRIFRGWVKIGKGGNKLIPYTFLYFKKQLLDVSTIHSPYPSIQTLRPIPSLFSAFLSSSTPPPLPLIPLFLFFFNKKYKK